MWERLPKPLFVLAPMADVTDPAFRRLIAKYGKPDVMWTEFVSADGLFLGGRDALMRDLAFTPEERPIVAQFFTARPELMKKAATLALELGFDGIDINMGCPDRSVEKQGSGAAHIKDPDNAVQIILAAKEGAGTLPVSVKTRVGYNKNDLDTWLPALLSAGPALITLHARTRKEMSKVPAHWEDVKRAVKIRNDYFGGRNEENQYSTLGNQCPTLIFGNGDVLTLEDAARKVEETGCDGVMIGKGIFGNPWLFSKTVHKGDLSIPEVLRVMIEHTKLYEEILPQKNFAIMKKHYKAYVNGFDGSKELRMRLMEAESAVEVEKLTEAFIETLS